MKSVPTVTWEKLHTIAPLVKLGQKMEKFINVMCKYMGKSQIWSKKKIYTKWVIFWFVWIAVQKSAKFKSSKVRDFRTFEPSKVQRSGLLHQILRVPVVSGKAQWKRQFLIHFPITLVFIHFQITFV